MNEDLPVVTPQRPTTARLTLEEMHGFLGGIVPGWYSTRDLHVRYTAWANREGKDVVSVKTLGESIRVRLQPDRQFKRGGQSIWNITEKLTRPQTEAEAFAEGRDWFRDTSTGQPA